MATFNKRRAPTSRKYVCEQGIVMPNLSKIIRTFRLHSSVFATKKLRKFSEFFLPLIDSLVATFNEMSAPTSRKNIAEQGIVMSN